MYTRPDSLEDALASLAEQRRVVLAGGTDFYPARVGRPIDDPVLDISRLEDLRVIHDEGDHFRIGALATWTDVIRSPLPPWFDGLKLAAREVGGVQIQNVGTVGGNVCNASPAADGVPNLLVLDARVELQSVRGARTLALSEFLVGNRQTDRAPDELVTAIVLPKPPGGAASTFLKLGARRYLVISIVMVAGLIARDGGGRVVDARVAVGSCSTVAQRLTELESDLCGRMADPHLSDAVAPEHLAPLSPIDDVRVPRPIASTLPSPCCGGGGGPLLVEILRGSVIVPSGSGQFCAAVSARERAFVVDAKFMAIQHSGHVRISLSRA